MPALAKLVAGIAASGILAYLAHGYERAALLAELGGKAASVMNAHGIRDGRAVWTSPSGWTFRIARLSGTADSATRERVRAVLSAEPGIHEVIWTERE